MHLFPIACLALCAIASPAAARQARVDPPAAAQVQADAAPLYELRIYYPEPGKAAALNARFREHTLALFAKHGMHNVAYWNEQPTAEAPQGRLIYVVRHASQAAREKSWAAFRTDPVWQGVQASSEAQGKLVTRIESIPMTMADYSPALPNP